MAGEWGVTPKASVLAEVRNAGLAEVVARCKAILAGRGLDASFLYVLAGPHSRQVLAGREGGPDGYWPRVWALRGLLYAWDDTAQTAVIDMTADPSWRVREMAANVVRAHLVEDALDVLSRLVDDPVPRVRTSALRARIALTEAGPGSPGRSRRSTS